MTGSIEIAEGQPGDYVGRRFDAVVANLTAEVIISLMDDLAGCLSPAGVMILSGILTTLRADVERAIVEAGMTVIERREAGEWTALVAQERFRLMQRRRFYAAPDSINGSTINLSSR